MMSMVSVIELYIYSEFNMGFGYLELLLLSMMLINTGFLDFVHRPEFYN
jgi:hypothetical protein